MELYRAKYDRQTESKGCNEDTRKGDDEKARKPSADSVVHDTGRHSQVRSNRTGNK